VASPLFAFLSCDDDLPTAMMPKLAVFIEAHGAPTSRTTHQLTPSRNLYKAILTISLRFLNFPETISCSAFSFSCGSSLKAIRSDLFKLFTIK